MLMDFKEKNYQPKTQRKVVAAKPKNIKYTKLSGKGSSYKSSIVKSNIGSFLDQATPFMAAKPQQKQKGMVKQIVLAEMPSKTDQIRDDDMVASPDSDSCESKDNTLKVSRSQQMLPLMPLKQQECALASENDSGGGGAFCFDDMAAQNDDAQKAEGSSSGGDLSELNDQHDSISGPYCTSLTAAPTIFGRV